MDDRCESVAASDPLLTEAVDEDSPLSWHEGAAAGKEDSIQLARLDAGPFE